MDKYGLFDKKEAEFYAYAKHVMESDELPPKTQPGKLSDSFEEKKESDKLIALLQDSNNPVHWIFINNKQMSDLAEYLVNNGVVVKESEG